MENEILEQPQIEGKYVVITGKFNCQSFPLNEKAILVPQEDLNQIGITKCFDLENNCVVDYDNTEELKKQTNIERIAELKSLLTATDYKAIKYAEGLITKTEYAETKALRQSYREEINKLEEELKTL